MDILAQSLRKSDIPLHDLLWPEVNLKSEIFFILFTKQMAKLIFYFGLQISNFFPLLDSKIDLKFKLDIDPWRSQTAEIIKQWN